MNFLASSKYSTMAASTTPTLSLYGVQWEWIGEHVWRSDALPPTRRLMALSRHAQCADECLLSGVKRTSMRRPVTTPDGQQAHGRYTDCWAKQNGKWLAVSAHVTR